MKMKWSTSSVSFRSGGTRSWKTLFAALLAALIVVPNVHGQANPTPASKAWSAANQKGARLYSMSFEGGPLSDLKRLWTNAFPNDNFLINFPEGWAKLPEFQLRDMTLPELARSIAFLGKGAFTVEVVERNDSLPGNIWRIARPSQEILGQSLKMRAVSAPRLFASDRTLERFLRDVEKVQNKMLELIDELRRAEYSTALIPTQILPLNEQRVFVLIGNEMGVSGLESLIKAAEQTATEPTGESKSGK